MRTNTLSKLAVLVLVFGATQTVAVGALEWNSSGTGYEGPINIDFDFVLSSGYNQNGIPISWGILTARTITKGPGGHVIWRDGDNGSELTGITYNLIDEARLVTGGVVPAVTVVDLWSSSFAVDLYEVPVGSFMAARNNGIDGNFGGSGFGAGWGGLANTAGGGIGDVSVFDKLTNLDPAGAALTGHGVSTAIHVPGIAENVLDPLSPPISTAAQKTQMVSVNGALVSGSSTAYVDWHGGYLFGTMVQSDKIEWGPHYPVDPSPGLVDGGDAMARTTLVFSNSDPAVGGPEPDGDMHSRGWEFISYGTGGSVDASVVPEPTTMAIVVMGLAGLVARRRRRR